ncbi:MAG: carbamoyltransferase [Candidatus Zixiibacteriota bacterium]
MKILGISCFYHDAAAALVIDGNLAAAALEERFTGIKHDADLPRNAIDFCLNKASATIDDLDYIIFYDKPFTKFDRILAGYIQTVPGSYPAFRKAVPVWLRKKLWLPQILKREFGFQGKVLFIEHHLSHAAGAYFSSPFDHAAILTIDGVGEWATASIGKGDGNKIEITKTMNYPHSVGLLYSAFTYFLGFEVNSAEYKIMGLAPYGNPKYVDLIKNKIVRIYEDGSIHLNMKYFKYHYGLAMTGKKFERLFGRPRRSPDSELTDSDRDIAASIQNVIEEIIFNMARCTQKLTNESRLCLSGGVALNCAAAGKLLQSGLYDDIYIQPASSDAGGAVGAALYAHYSLTGTCEKIGQPYFSLGPSYPASEIENILQEMDAPYKSINENELPRLIAEYLAEGKIVAVFHGPMEFGPRALGFRSILADSRKAEMKERINKAVKFREPFRPFAPAVLDEKAADYFEKVRKSPYMLFNFEVRPEKRSEIPAVTHIDGTARIQTVNRDDNRMLYDILTEFEKLTETAVLLNTSFNLRGHPIVLSPRDAFKTFISSGIDILVLENHIIDKKDIPSGQFSDFKIAAGHD